MVPRRRTIEMLDGREIKLIRLFREDTYLGLHEGYPNSLFNDRRILDMEAQGKRIVCNSTPVILPFQVKRWPDNLWVPFQREIDSTRALSDNHEIFAHTRESREILPSVISFGLFDSAPIKDDPENGDWSELAAIWLQNDPNLVIAEEPLELLRRVKWDEMAFSMEL